MCDIVAGYTVVIEQIPLALVLYDRVVSGPSYDGIQDDALIGERSVGVVADGIAQQVAVTRRIGEVVLAIVLMHPAGLKEAVGVTSLQGLTVLINDDKRTWSLCKLKHVITHAYYCAGNSGSVGLGKQLCLVVGSGTQVDETIVVTVFAGDSLKAMIGGVPPLELSTPQSTEVAVYLAVVILEDAGVDRERATDRLILGNKRTFGLISNSNTQMEHTVIAFR